MNRTANSVLGTLLIGAFVAGVVFLFALFFISLGMPEQFWIVILAGALGGLVGNLIVNKGRFCLAKITEESPGGHVWIDLGTVGDLLIGIGGALTLVFLFGSTLNFDFNEPTKPGSLFLLTSVSFVAGAVGRPLIAAAGQRLAREALGEAKEARHIAQEVDIKSYYILARLQRGAGFLGSALELIDNVLKSRPDHAGAHVEKGRILKRMALKQTPPEREKLERALEHSRTAAKIRPTMDAAWYNMACYQALLDKDPEEIITHLKKAFVLDPNNQELASNDSDLKSMRTNPEFQALLSQQSST